MRGAPAPASGAAAAALTAEARTSSLVTRPFAPLGGTRAEVDPELARERARRRRRERLRVEVAPAPRRCALRLGGRARRGRPRVHEAHPRQRLADVADRGRRGLAALRRAQPRALDVRRGRAASPPARSNTTSTACTGTTPPTAPRSLEHLAGLRRRDGDRRLVGHHLDDRLVLGDVVARRRPAT